MEGGGCFAVGNASFTVNPYIYNYIDMYTSYEQIFYIRALLYSYYVYTTVLRLALPGTGTHSQ